jgi:hypothetical protein
LRFEVEKKTETDILEIETIMKIVSITPIGSPGTAAGAVINLRYVIFSIHFRIKFYKYPNNEFKSQEG